MLKSLPGIRRGGFPRVCRHHWCTSQHSGGTCSLHLKGFKGQSNAQHLSNASSSVLEKRSYEVPGLVGWAHRAVLSPHKDVQMRGGGLSEAPQLLVARGSLRCCALQLLQQHLRQNPLLIHPAPTAARQDMLAHPCSVAQSVGTISTPAPG